MFLSIIHVRHGSSSAHPRLNGTLSHPDTPDALLNEAAKRKVDKYRNSYANNHSISFLPAITSISARMHGEFLRLLFFLQTHRETEDYFVYMDTPAQPEPDGILLQFEEQSGSHRCQSRCSAYQYEHRQLPGRLAYCVQGLECSRAMAGRSVPSILLQAPLQQGYVTVITKSAMWEHHGVQDVHSFQVLTWSSGKMYQRHRKSG